MPWVAAANTLSLSRYSDWRGAKRPPNPPTDTELCPGTANGADWPGDGKLTYGDVGLFCNGLNATSAPNGAQTCLSVNYPPNLYGNSGTLSDANNIANPHQSFYCYGQCGQLYSTDIT